MMTRLSVCSLGVSCNDMFDTPMLLVVVIRSGLYADVQGTWGPGRQNPEHVTVMN